jgi:hypothetical protein
MNKKPDRKPDDQEQSKRFIEGAKEAGADETEKGADKAFKRVISRPSHPIPAPKASSGSRSKD